MEAVQDLGVPLLVSLEGALRDLERSPKITITNKLAIQTHSSNNHYSKICKTKNTQKHKQIHTHNIK